MKIEIPDAKMIIQLIRSDLQEAGDPVKKASTQQFFKQPVLCYGVNVPDTRAIGKRYWLEVKAMPKKSVFAICEALWKSGTMEESIIACQYSYTIRKSFEPADFKVLERWISKYVNNWASCDTLCNHTVGEFLQAYPEYLTELERWAQSDNRWMRRAAAVSLIVPAGKGKFPETVFQLSLRLLTDPDDLVQKGYGWLLKSASKRHPKQVFKFVMKYKASMPRTALRYAIEKLDPNSRMLAMA